MWTLSSTSSLDKGNFPPFLFNRKFTEREKVDRRRAGPRSVNAEWMLGPTLIKGVEGHLSSCRSIPESSIHWLSRSQRWMPPKTDHKHHEKMRTRKQEPKILIVIVSNHDCNLKKNRKPWKCNNCSQLYIEHNCTKKHGEEEEILGRFCWKIMKI